MPVLRPARFRRSISMRSIVPAKRIGASLNTTPTWMYAVERVAVNENDRLAALAAETGVLGVHRDDVELLKAGESFRCRPGVPGESAGGFCAGVRLGLVIVMVCPKGGVCRRPIMDLSGGVKRDGNRRALPEDEAWFAEHAAERYRVRALPPLEGPDRTQDERARRLVVVEREQRIVPWTISIDCAEVQQ